jgi:drug/metabolite transporter (DMT)-like permease
LVRDGTLTGVTGDRRVLAALATTLVLWASAFVAIRMALPGFGVAALSVGRLLVASAVLAIAAPALRIRMPARTDLLRIVGCGLTGMTAYQLLLNAGERSVPAGTASLLVNASPVFAAVLAFGLLGERLSRRGVGGLALGFAGATVIAVAQGDGFVPSVDALLVLGAAAAQALFFVLQKPLLGSYRGVEVTCYTMWAGTVLAAPLIPALVRDLPSAGVEPVGALVFLGVAPSALGFVTWAYAQARLPVAAAANALYVVPALALGIGWAVLGETAHLAALVGGVATLAGVAVFRSSTPHRAALPDPTPSRQGE